MTEVGRQKAKGRRRTRDEGRRTTGNPSYVLCCSSSGFTLVEALLSVVIIAVGTIFILQAFGQELTAAGISRDNIKAVLFLKEKMTEIEGEISRAGNPVSFPREGRFSGAGEKDFSWTLSFLPSELNKGLTEICLSCFWKSRGKTCRVNLATFARQALEE